VSPGDPNLLYKKSKRVGQGYVYNSTIKRILNSSILTILFSASGSVYLATQLSTSLRVAIKQMDLAHQARKDLIMNEIMIMKESHHGNVVNFLDSFLLSGDLWVVMEYMEGGALTDVIDNNEMTEPQIASVCLEVRCRLFLQW
jgi:protein-serine/threonine kinase